MPGDGLAPPPPGGRIEAPHFVAGVLLNESGHVERAAPIVGYMVGWHRDRVRAYVARKGWRITGMRPP